MKESTNQVGEHMLASESRDKKPERGRKGGEKAGFPIKRILR